MYGSSIQFRLTKVHAQLWWRKCYRIRVVYYIDLKFTARPRTVFAWRSYIRENDFFINLSTFMYNQVMVNSLVIVLILTSYIFGNVIELLVLLSVHELLSLCSSALEQSLLIRQSKFVALWFHLIWASHSYLRTQKYWTDCLHTSAKVQLMNTNNSFL